MSLQVSKFESWDEINVGDELVWGPPYKNDYPYHVEVLTKPRHNILHAKTLNYMSPYPNGYDGWNPEIWGGNPDSMGWRKVDKYMSYDPNQQGEDDDSI